MKQQEFIDFFKQRGYAVTEKMTYGIEEDYPISVQYISKSAGALQVRISAQIDNWKEYKKEFKRDLEKKYSIAYSDGLLSFLVSLKGGEFSANYNEAVSKITGYLKQKGIKTPDTCPLCKQKNCNILVAHTEGYRPAHKNCLDNVSEAVFQKAEKNDLNGNYFLGFIGALLGAIAGTIPSVLSIIWTDTIYSLLFALIPLCIYTGYKWFRGKMNQSVIILSIVLSVLSVYIIEIVVLAYALMAGYSLTVSQVGPLLMEALKSTEVWIEMTQDSITSFLFIALGIWIAWEKITKTSHTEVESMQNILSTARTYGAGENEIQGFDENNGF